VVWKRVYVTLRQHVHAAAAGRTRMGPLQTSQLPRNSLNKGRPLPLPRPQVGGVLNAACGCSRLEPRGCLLNAWTPACFIAVGGWGQGPSFKEKLLAPPAPPPKRDEASAAAGTRDGTQPDAAKPTGKPGMDRHSACCRMQRVAATPPRCMQQPAWCDASACGRGSEWSVGQRNETVPRLCCPPSLISDSTSDEARPADSSSAAPQGGGGDAADIQFGSFTDNEVAAPGKEASAVGICVMDTAASSRRALGRAACPPSSLACLGFGHPCTAPNVSGCGGAGTVLLVKAASTQG
jgi:hypothetical protein